MNIQQDMEGDITGEIPMKATNKQILEELFPYLAGSLPQTVAGEHWPWVQDPLPVDGRFL